MPRLMETSMSTKGALGSVELWKEHRLLTCNNTEAKSLSGRSGPTHLEHQVSRNSSTPDENNPSQKPQNIWKNCHAN